MFAPESSLRGIIAIAASYIQVTILVRKHENLSLDLKPSLRAIAASGDPGTKNDVLLYKNHHFVAAGPWHHIKRGNPGTKQADLFVYHNHHFVAAVSLASWRHVYKC